MTQEERTAIENRIADFMAKLDAAIAGRLHGKPVSCRTCTGAHCCYLPVESGMSEGLYAAIEIARWPDFRHMVGTLTEHAREQTSRGYWGTAWFERHIPCPFLLADNSCRIYDRRPVACRAHFVASPPENCALGAEDPTTGLYDAAVQALPHVSRLDGELHGAFEELGPPHPGFFTHLVLYALQFVVQGGNRRFVEKRIAKLPHPREWTERAMREQATILGKSDPRTHSMVSLRRRW